MGGSALACFVLFQAFLDEISEAAGQPFHSVDIAKVSTLVSTLTLISSYTTQNTSPLEEWSSRLGSGVHTSTCLVNDGGDGEEAGWGGRK